MTDIVSDTEALTQDETYRTRSVTRPHDYPNGPRDLHGLFRWLAGGLKAYMIAELALTLVSIFLAWLYMPTTVAPFTYEQLEMADYGIMGVTLFQITTYIFCVFMTCRVTYRAMRNLHTVNSDEAQMSPGWAVGWYFIPFANFWQPANGMSQIYHGTHKAVGEKSRSSSPIPAWWTMWLISNFSANISMRMSGGFAGGSYSTTTFIIDGISSVTAIITAYLFLRLLRRVNERQKLLKHGGVATVFD